MTDPDPSSDLAPLPAGQAAELATVARGELRTWLRAKPAAVLDRIDRLGRDEIAAAAALIARLDTARADSRADALLGELRRLVDEVHAPPPRRYLGLPLRQPPLPERLATAEPAIARTLDALAGERDRLARAAVTGRSLAARFADADAALGRVAHLFPLLERAVAAAERELAGSDPPRAAALRGDVALRLTERHGDVLTQYAVLHQARLSLDLLLDGEEALARAIDRTRHVMVSALRTAVAALRGMTDGARMGAQAAALDEGDARRALAGAVAEMREMLAGVAPPP